MTAEEAPIRDCATMSASRDPHVIVSNGTASVHLTLAVCDYEHVREITQGIVRADGIALTPLIFPSIEEITFRFTRSPEWDVSELSFGKYISLTSQGNAPMIAIPVFPSRVHRHSAIYVRSDRGIKTAKDLEGRAVGIPEWAQTAGIYVRGMLAEEEGVDLAKIKWLQAGVDEPGRAEKVELKLPSGIRYQEQYETEPVNTYIKTIAFSSYTQSVGVHFGVTSLTVLLWHVAICLVDITIQLISDALFLPITTGGLVQTTQNMIVVQNWLHFPFIMAFAAFLTVFFYLSVPFVASAVMKGLSGTTASLQAGVHGTMGAAGLIVGTGLTVAGAAATFGGSAAAQAAIEGTKFAAGTASSAGRIGERFSGGPW